MPLGGLVAQLWSLAACEVGGTADLTEIARVFERWAGVEIAGSAEAVDAVG